MKYQKQFSIIDTPQKAYFLGLMYSDGCIAKKSNSVKISLTDKQLIEDVIASFDFLKKSITDFSKYNKNSKIQYCAFLYNKDLKKDLVKHGVLPQKSTVNKELINFPVIREDLYRHFIRGYFDGDGSIYSTKRRPTNYIVEICSVSKEFLLQMQSYLNTKLKIDIRFREKDNKTSSLCVLYCLRNSDLLILKEFLYEDSVLYLQRKKSLFDKVSLMDCNERQINNTKKKNKKIGLKCKYCESFHVRKSGICDYTGKQRFKCITCNRKFSKPIQAHLKFGEFRENPEVDNPEPSST